MSQSVRPWGWEVVVSLENRRKDFEVESRKEVSHIGNNNRSRKPHKCSENVHFLLILLLSCQLLQISCFTLPHGSVHLTNNMRLFQRIQRPSLTHPNLYLWKRRKLEETKLFSSSSQSSSSPLWTGSSIPSPSSQPKYQDHHITTKAEFKIPMPQWNNNSNSFLSSLSTATTDKVEFENIAQWKQQQNQQLLYEPIFTLDLPEGKCVGLRLSTLYQEAEIPTSLCRTQIISNENHWIRQILHPEEIQYGIDLPSDTARRTFFIGRLAMRTALKLASGCDTKVTTGSDEGSDISTSISSERCNDIPIGYEDRKFGGFIQLPAVSSMDHSILKDDYGRPQVPNGFIGSISHKKTTGVALISNLPHSMSSSPPKIGIGVDIEQTFSRSKSIAKKILTKHELDNLGQLKGITVDEEVLLRFSLKECVYKAMHPLISQWVGFQEAEIQPHDDGTATVTLNLKSGAHEKFQKIDAHWRRLDGDEFFLTSSCVTMNDNQ